MQLPPDLVIFDCDGVLVDSEPITNRVLQSNLAGHGLDMPIDQILSLFVGGTMPGVMQEARKMGADLPEDWLDEIYAHMLDALGREVELVPGILGVLDRLDAAGIPYAVGSNGPHEKMDVTLARTGLKDRLEGRIVSRVDVPNPKPAPDVYLEAARRVGVSADRCVVVDDSPSGVRAGQAAGMLTFGFATEFAPEKLRPYCHFVFDDMALLPDLLEI